MQYEEVVGMDFLTAQRHFPSAVLAGLVCQDGHISLAPDMDRIIEPEDRLLFFSEDRLVQCDKNVAAIPRLLEVKHGFFERASRGKQKILIVGWRSGMKNLLDYINLRSARGSTVTIFSPEPVRSREQQLVDGGGNANRSFPNIRIEHVVGDHTSPSTVEKLMHHYPRFNAVLLLMGDKAMDSQEEARYADSVALRVMTVMRSVLSDRVDKLLVEVLQRETGMDIADRDKLHIYPISLVDTFARIMAQASLQPHLHYFLLELLTRPHAHGIGLESKSDYFDVHAPRDESTTFWELSNVGAQRGRVLIGYKFEDGHTELNPPDKEKAIDLSRIDSFVTLRPLTVSIKP
uniref:CASTOR/POLLUX/SYM8 ion channel conserved domain-containing protein n=1 Tax=Rhodosorus marinus TaxID=101924 RepID=A0A7S3EKM3_9RHOD|mmetsp:Transcript_43777/g.171262  ORF Transcript_43777/g.171262 Transcript_43777/m.171262 type:complete len:347 (+) Transcript_43777:1625-2665(+)